LTVLLAAGCGRKNDPSPPLPRGPRAVSDLAVEQEGADAVLTFSYPDRLVTGEPLTDLAAIEVYRVVGASPSLAAPRPRAARGAAAGDRAPATGARREAQNVRLAEEAFYRDARRVAALPAGDLGRYTRGASVVVRDPLLPLPEKDRGRAVAYAVSAVRRAGERSPLSNIVLVTPEVPPGPPEIVRATPEEGRICLEWTAPETDLDGKPARVGAYNVYRRTLPAEEYETPANAAPVSGTAWIDTAPPYGAVHFYTVRATLPDKPKVEGPPALELGLEYRDVFPPAAPPRLAALPETTLVRLIWDPSPSPDVAGYLVFRAEGDGRAAPLTDRPVADTFWTDTRVVTGRRYRYTVRAVDAAGNRSEPSAEAIGEPF
jgi:hypothetical protein